MIDGQQYMTLEDYDSLNDENNVARLHAFDRGPETVEFHDVGPKVHRVVFDDLVGDDDTRLFFSSDGGELKITYGPAFDAPITTNASREQLQLALRTLAEEHGHRHRPAIDVLFDDAGPIVFRADGDMTVTTPMKFPWQHGDNRQQPRSPCGPSVCGDLND